ncbi:MAG: glycosyltransferase [Desulfobacterales bacterium]|nr:glycosyltransferase [Desulfobacterales bacterium]
MDPATGNRLVRITAWGRSVAIGKPDLSVSVIIPTYNRGWTLRAAIDSVLAQTYRNFELIVVDDGSSDDTAEILQSYGPSIQVLRQANTGVSAARNTGIRSAKGALIAFLDSDDCWLPGKLGVQVDFFDSHPEAVICQTEETWIRNGKRVNPKKVHQKPSGHIFQSSLVLCLVSPSAVMLRKALFDEIGGFDETLTACEDYDLWLRVSARYPVHLIQTPLIIKNGGHADQLSRMPGLDRYRIKAIEKILATGNLSTARRTAAIEMLVKKAAIYAGGCRKRGKINEARVYENLIRAYR